MNYKPIQVQLEIFDTLDSPQAPHQERYCAITDTSTTTLLRPIYEGDPRKSREISLISFSFWRLLDRPFIAIQSIHPLPISQAPVHDDYYFCMVKSSLRRRRHLPSITASCAIPESLILSHLIPNDHCISHNTR